MDEDLAYLNGRYLPVTEASIPLHDAGFVLGATVSDQCRTFRHGLFRLDDHFKRFRASCKSARVPLLVSDSELRAIAAELVGHNAARAPREVDFALVLFATPGPIGYFAGQPGGAGDGPPTIGLHTFPLRLERYARFHTSGVALVTPSIRHVPVDCVDPRIKQRSRMHWWLAEQEAHATDPEAAALLLDHDGRITETAAANFLLVRDGRVLSPRREGILNGISLLTVEDLCRAIGLPFEECDLRPADCHGASEAMLASTPYCLAPVRRINDISIPWPGPIFERLLAGWSHMVGVDIRKQILAAAPAS